MPDRNKATRLKFMPFLPECNIQALASKMPVNGKMEA